MSTAGRGPATSLTAMPSMSFTPLLILIGIVLQDAGFSPHLIYHGSRLVEAGGIRVVGQWRRTKWEQPIKQVVSHDLLEIAKVAEVERIGPWIGFQNGKGTQGLWSKSMRS